MTPPQTNLLLDCLSADSRSQILATARLVDLPLRTEMGEADRRSAFAWFPVSGLASTVIELYEGGVAEVALTGREGLVGAYDLLGPLVTPCHTFVQMKARAYRLRLSELNHIFQQNAEVRGRILELVQQQSLTMSQLAACNKLHGAEARLARWLLMVRDRVQDDIFLLTQEFLAQMLGTRRTTVVMAAGALQRSGFITYTRGKIHILDPDQLESVACECYRVTQRLFHNLYGKVDGERQPVSTGIRSRLARPR